MKNNEANYIKIINSFWDIAPHLEGYKSDYGILFFAIIDSINKNGWKDSEIGYELIINKSKLAKRAYLDGRKWLKENNFISLVEGRGDYQKAKFGLFDAVRNCTANDTAINTAGSTATDTTLDTATDTHIIDKPLNFKTSKHLNNNINTEFSKNENSSPSQKEIELALEIENLKSENQSLKAEQKKAPQAGGAVKKPKSETDNKETYGEHENVRLTQVEHDKLLAQHGETILCEIFKKLSNYKLSTGKKYKSDYGAINTWVVDSVRKDLKSQPQARFTQNFTGLDTDPPVDKYKQASEAVKQKMRDSITENMYATN